MPHHHEPSVAFFNSARSYQASALCLQMQETPLPCYLDGSPLRVLLAFAIELYLKSFLLMTGEAIEEIKSYNHKVKKLCKRCEDLGLVISQQDRQLIFAIQDNNIISADRYLVTGTRRIPNDVRMQEVSEYLFSEIGTLLAQHSERTLTNQGISRTRRLGS